MTEEIAPEEAPPEAPTNFSGYKVSTAGEFISAVTFSPNAMEANLAALPEGWRLFAGEADPATQWLDGVTVSSRPLLVADTDRQIAIGETVTFTVPAETESTAYVSETIDGRTRERRLPVDLSAGSFAFTGGAPGAFRFELTPPFPFRRQIITIDVTGQVPITAADVYAEKDRRLAAGFDYNFGGERGVHHIGTTPSDMLGWDEVTKLAQALINTGNGPASIIVLTDTGMAEITAIEWQTVLLAAAAFRQPIWAKSFELAAISPIPADYADDHYWQNEG